MNKHVIYSAYVLAYMAINFSYTSQPSKDNLGFEDIQKPTEHSRFMSADVIQESKIHKNVSPDSVKPLDMTKILPTEIWYKILSYIPCSQLKNISLTHSLFNEYHKNNGTINLTLTLKDIESLGTSFQKFTSMRMLNSLTFEGDWRGAGAKGIFHDIFKYLPNVNRLNLSHCILNDKDTVFLSVLLPRVLKTLSINLLNDSPDSFYDNKVQESLLSYCGALQHLLLDNMNINMDSLLQSLPPSLISLEMKPYTTSSCTDLISRNIKTPFPTHLNKLIVDKSDWYSLNNVVTFIDTMPETLIYLGVINHGLCLDFNAINEILLNCPKSLQHLDLSDSRFNRCRLDNHQSLLTSNYINGLRGNQSFNKIPIILDTVELSSLEVLNIGGNNINRKTWIKSTNPNTCIKFDVTPNPILVLIENRQPVAEEKLVNVDFSELYDLMDYYINQPLFIFHNEFIENFTKFSMKLAHEKLSCNDHKSFLNIMGLMCKYIGNYNLININRDELSVLLYRAATILDTQAESTEKFFRSHSMSTLERTAQCKYLKTAMHYGHVEAQYTLGILYKKGLLGQDYCLSMPANDLFPNYNLALVYLLPLAKQGHIKAQHNVGVIYYNIDRKDDAIHWFSQSAAQGLQESINNLKQLTSHSEQ